MFSLFEVLGEVGKALLDFVYPPYCLGCEKGIEEAGEYLCAACWKEIAAPVPVRCERCSCPLEKGGSSCPNCAAWEPVFERAVVMGRFSGRMQQAIHALKFRQQRELGRMMGKRMGREMGEFLHDVDLLVPVPLHPARQRERGYNQSLCIARGLAEELGVRVEDGLVKRRVNTRQQARLDAMERQENLSGSFCCVKGLPEHRCIGLVDDVLTTGATFNACAETLVQEGAKSVWALALASPFHEAERVENRC